MGVNEDLKIWKEKFIHCMHSHSHEDYVKVEWQNHLCIFNGFQAHTQSIVFLSVARISSRHHHRLLLAFVHSFLAINNWIYCIRLEFAPREISPSNLLNHWHVRECVEFVERKFTGNYGILWLRKNCERELKHTQQQQHFLLLQQFSFLLLFLLLLSLELP